MSKEGVFCEGVFCEGVFCAVTAVVNSSIPSIAGKRDASWGFSEHRSLTLSWRL